MQIARLLAGLLALALPVGSAHAASADSLLPVASGASMTTGAPVHLFVELTVNGVAVPGIVEIVQQDGHMLVDAATLRAAHVAATGEGLLNLSQVRGIDADYDAEQQRLHLTVADDLLPINAVAADARAQMPISTSPGALLNYDLFAQRAGGRTSLSLWSEQRLFGPLGILSNTGVLRTGGFTRSGYIRYDTSYRYIDENRALVATAGDTITGALPWSSAVRIGGLQIARSFRTRPDLITMPLPDFRGQAALPSSVDLFVNGYRQQQSQVAPGRFVLNNVPVVNGAGEARVVTTDALGRQVATVIPFYVAPDLLRPGLTDFSLELGALRRDYGITSLSYGRMVANASVRHGITRHVTLEGHGEAARNLALGGVGVVWSPGLWGAVNVSAAVSRRDGMTGRQAVIGYTYSGRRFTIGAEHRERSDAFADLGGFDLGRWRGRSQSDRVSGSLALGRLGSMGAAYISARTRDGNRARIATASWSVSLRNSLSAFAAADYDLSTKRASAQVRLVMAFGPSAASVGISRQAGGRMRFEGDYARTLPSDGGLGYGASGAMDERGAFTGQANAIWRGPAFEVAGGAAHSPGASSIWAGASGSVALLGGKPYLANQLPAAFAVVETGMPGVSVYYENQRIGETQKDGRLFVPRVTAYHPSNFTIDIMDLPEGVEARTIEQRIAVRDNSGAVIAMPVRLMRSATVALTDGAGRPLPPGTPVSLSSGDGSVSMVGWDGIVLLQGMTGPVVLNARMASGPCTARLAIAADTGLVANLGTLACR